VIGSGAVEVAVEAAAEAAFMSRGGRGSKEEVRKRRRH